MQLTDSPNAPTRPVMETAPGPMTRLNGRECLYFAGTGYLGLQADPEVLAAAVAGAKRFGVHSATSRSGFGSSPPVLEVEQRIAEFMGCEESWYLVTGYAGNFSLASTVREEVDLALVDEAAHDCVREATRWLNLVRPSVPFRHRDTTHLSELLASEVQQGERVLVLTDGVFAASGRLAPLRDILELLSAYPGAQLLVDDAHGVGVLGERGRGSLEVVGVPAAEINSAARHRGVRVLQSITISKALGGHGGALAGSRDFLERCQQASGWFRGASAPAAPVAAASAKAIELVQSRPELRQSLAGNIEYARTRLRNLGLGIENLPTAIISFELASAAEMQRVQQALLTAGVAIAHTRDYAGAGPDGMLRIAIFATHTHEMIDQLADSLGRVL